MVFNEVCAGGEGGEGGGEGGGGRGGLFKPAVVDEFSLRRASRAANNVEKK
jgi:hypothetical protein